MATEPSPDSRRPAPPGVRGPRTRRTLFASAAGASGALLAACGPGTPAGPPAPVRQGTLVYRTWWAPSTEAHKTWWEFVKPDFEAKHPGVTLTLEFFEFGAAYEKFAASLAANDLPDAMHSSTVWGRDFWNLGALEELSPYVARTPALAMDKFIPAALFYNQAGGKVYGIPHEGPDASLFFYNASHFAAAGLDPAPRAVDRWTWDDLVQAASRLTRRGAEGERVGLALPPLGVRPLATWLHTQGGSFYTREQTGVGFDNERGESVVQHYLDLRSRAGPPPAGVHRDLFLQGQASIIYANLFLIGDFKLPALKPAFDWGVLPFPKGPQGPAPAAATFVNMDVVPKGGKRKDLAHTWLTYYTGLEMGRARLRLIGRANPRKEFYDTPEFKAEVAAHPQAARIPEMAAVGAMIPFLRATEIGKEVEPVLVEAGEGKRGPREALREAARLANQILSRPATGA
jgi:multiple sugar transport system substrate-binding protein